MPRRLFSWFALGALWLASPVWSQSPPQCDTQIQEQYLSLSREQPPLVPPTLDLPWPQQLTAMTTQVRLLRTQLDIKKQQAELAEQNVAQLLEQLRLSRQQQVALQAEVERLKAPKAAEPAPAN